jgi:hypothetical protein
MSVTRRGRRWRLRLDPSVTPSARLAEVVTARPGATISPSGEMTLPTGDNGTDIADILALLEALAVTESSVISDQ